MELNPGKKLKLSKYSPTSLPGLLPKAAIIKVLREGTAALSSVFTVEDVKGFVHLARADKMSQLNELMATVSGIRLFNKDCQKAGEGIPDVPSNLLESSQASSLSLTNCLLRIMERINILSTAVDTHYDIDDAGKMAILNLRKGEFSFEDFSIVTKALALYRQYEIIVRQLIVTIETVLLEAKTTVAAYRDTLSDAHSIVRYRVVVLAKQIFPIFTKLWKHWRKMQGDLYVVSCLNNLLAKLDSIHEQLTFTSVLTDRLLDRLLGGRAIETDEHRLDKTAHHCIQQEDNICTVLDYTHLRIRDPSEFAYVGFCAMSICIGVLVPGYPIMGVLMWNDKSYVFSSEAFATAFGAQPDKYIKGALNYIRQNPELINLLKVYDDLYKIQEVKELVPASSIKKSTQTKSIQTDLHPDCSNTTAQELQKWELDRTNCNVWEYKQIACRWASVVKCTTHGAQTKESNWRFDFGCQTHENADKGVQTRKEQGTAPPKTQTYLRGLRGLAPQGQHVVDLTQTPSAHF